MDISERAKMAAGEWYTCIDPELEALRAAAHDAVHEHNSMRPGERGNMGPALRLLLAQVGDNARVEAPFHCAYGINIELGDDVFLNAGCTILDTARVRIGSSALLGPNVQILPSTTRMQRCAAPGWRSPGRSKSARTYGSAAARSFGPAFRSAMEPSWGRARW